MKKVKSAKGAMVDFDLIKIKQQMTTAPLPLDVRQRQDFIENRLRRRARKQVTLTPPNIDRIDVTPALPTEGPTANALIVDEPSEPQQSKQRARPKQPKSTGE